MNDCGGDRHGGSTGRTTLSWSVAPLPALPSLQTGARHTVPRSAKSSRQGTEVSTLQPEEGEAPWASWNSPYVTPLGRTKVGSPETVIRQLKEQHQRIGYDIFCANHRIGPMPSEQSLKSLQLFGKEVIPAFT